MFRKITLLFTVFIVFNSCTTSEGEGETLSDSFDRKAMLTYLSDQIIIPSYDDFSTKMESLKSIGETFTNNPTEATLEDVRTAWLTAYKSWQRVEMFNINKAEEVQYSFYMNVYPVTVNDVENNIANGSYDLNSVNNQDAQGFPALDYLFYGIGTNDTEILEKFTTASNYDNYKKYVTDVLSQMSRLTNEVITAFKANRDNFVNSASNTATSSVNKLINDYVFYFEKGLRSNKIGIPAGFFSATPLPDRVEAFYNKEVSKLLVLEAFTAVQDLFLGKSLNTTANSISFKDYLIALNRQDLATQIEAQFTAAKTQINSLDNNFSLQIELDNSQMLKTRDELQKAVISLKVDMLQAFNISVDYVDADGD